MTSNSIEFQTKPHYASSRLLFMCFSVGTLTEKIAFTHFWAAIRALWRKLSRWVWNMQQFVWSLRCLFRTAFAYNYNKPGSMPCYWCIPFVLRSNFLFLLGEKSRLVSFNVQPTSITTPQRSAAIALYLEECLQDCKGCRIKAVAGSCFKNTVILKKILFLKCFFGS